MKLSQTLGGAIATSLIAASGAFAVTVTEDDFEGSFDYFDVYEFNVELGGGARFEGVFVAADFDGDNVISSNAFINEQRLDSNGAQIDITNEVALLRGQYIGPVGDLAELGSQDYSFDFGAFFSDQPANMLAFHLDGEGRIGGGTILPHPELLNLVTNVDLGPGAPTSYVIAAGEVQDAVFNPISQLTGSGDTVSAVLPCLPGQECAIVYEGFEEVIEDPFDPDGEPAFIEDFRPVSIAFGLEGRTAVTSGPLGDALGVDEVAALLPDATNDDGSFQFDIDFDQLGVSPDQVFFIDPDIAVGYTYEVTGASFTSVKAPTLGAVNDPDGYTLSFGATIVSLAPGELFLFDTPISEFMLSGISQDLMLDPTDDMAFVTGVSVDTTVGQISILQSPITAFVDPGTPSAVPLPASLLFLLAGLGSLLGLRRKI